VHSLDRETHISIFGTDFYDAAMSNLDALLRENEKFGRTVTLYVVLTTLNADALKEFERFGSKVRLRVSGCTNRALEGFAHQLIDLKAARKFNHYGTISSEAPMCGYAQAALVVDATGKYLLCTNDVERKTGLGTIWDHSVSEVFSAIRAGLARGDFLWMCRRCENFEPYRQQLEAAAPLPLARQSGS
jgi:hypothetical protein